jgi:hypothetical protein
MDHIFRLKVVTVSHDPSNSFKVTKDLDSVDKLFDRDLLLLPDEDSDFPESLEDKITYVPDGWKIRTAYRHISMNH